MSGSGERGFRIGDIIQKGENYGQITGGAKGAWTIKIYNEKGVLGSAETGVADSALKRGGYQKFMSNNGMNSVMEVAYHLRDYPESQKVQPHVRTAILLVRDVGRCVRTLSEIFHREHGSILQAGGGCGSRNRLVSRPGRFARRC